MEGRSGPVLRSAPLEVGPLLAKDLYPRYKAVVMSSATLSVEGSFDFTLRRLGLDEGDPDSGLATRFRLRQERGDPSQQPAA